MWKRKSKQQHLESTWEEDCYNDDTSYNEEGQLNFNQQIQKIDKVNIKKNKKRTKNKDFYVKGSELKQEIRKYQQSKKADAEKKGVPYEQGEGVISEKLGQMIIKICTRFSMHPRFYRLFIQR